MHVVFEAIFKLKVSRKILAEKFCQFLIHIFRWSSVRKWKIVIVCIDTKIFGYNIAKLIDYCSCVFNFFCINLRQWLITYFIFCYLIFFFIIFFIIFTLNCLILFLLILFFILLFIFFIFFSLFKKLLLSVNMCFYLAHLLFKNLFEFRFDFIKTFLNFSKTIFFLLNSLVVLRQILY